MKSPSSDVTMVPCLGCSRDVLVPKGRVTSAIRRGRVYPAFCSRRCEKVFIAKRGAQLHEENVRRHYSDAQSELESGS